MSILRNWHLNKSTNKQRFSTLMIGIQIPYSNPTRKFHTHEEDDLVIGHDRVRHTLRNNIRQDPGVPIKRVYDHVARNYVQGGGDRETIQEFHKVRSSMTRARLEHVLLVCMGTFS
jgi:hypothetical protein